MPDDQANHLITTFGILGCTCAGIGGAVLTLRGYQGLTLLPLAELGLGFVASGLIAACGLVRGKREEPARPVRSTTGRDELTGQRP